jgi:hypothetical protein
VLRWIVPLSLLALPVVAHADTPLPADAWWEKVTIKMTGDGEAQGCQYQTNRPASAGADCKVVGASGVAASASTDTAMAKDGYTSITFERRFNLGAAPGNSAIQEGEKLLGKKVMALAIDKAGKVSGCKVVDLTGDTGLAYGCEEASNEHFAANGAAATAPDRQGFMTILVYGHNEHVV